MDKQNGKKYFIIKNKRIYRLIKKIKIENFEGYTSDSGVSKLKAKADGHIERYVHPKPMSNLNFIPS